MTTRQSTTLHMSGDGEDPNNGLAFSTIDIDTHGHPSRDYDPVLEVWGTIQAPDGQVLTAKMQHAMPDVRDLQSFLNDNFGRGVAKLPESVADTVQTAIANLLAQGYKVITPDGFHEVTQNNIPPAMHTVLDGAKAQYFKDGWHASLRELLEMGKVRGYEAAIDWAKAQMGVYVGPAALAPTSDSELPGMWETSDFEGSESDTAPRQCPYISNGVQCTYPEHDPVTMHSYQSAPSVQDWAEAKHQPDVDLFQEQAAAIQTADPATAPRFILGPKNAAEQARKRRLKLEMEFDDAAEKHKSDWHNPGAVAALNEAAVALHKREPDNSRVVNFLFDPASAPPVQTEQTARAESDQLPEAHFAPDPAPAHQPIPYNGGGRSLHDAEEQMERTQFPGADPTQMSTAQQAWTNNPDGSASFSPIAAEQTAAQAFPCPHQASDGRPCQRPASHEIELPTRPAVPHVYATNPATLTEAHGGPVYPDQAVQQQTMPNQPPPPYVAPAQPFQQPHLQAVPDQTNVAVMSFHEGEPGMPAAPAMPTWQAPQQ